MAALGDRLRWIAEQRGIDQRTLGIKAGLAESFLSAYLQRAQQNPKATIAADAAAKLADTWRVDLRWLITGEGSPELSPEDAYRVVYDPRYPNLAKACELAESASREARAQVLNQHWEMPGDQDVDWWLVHLRRTEDRILREKAMPPAELAALKAAQKKVVDDLEAKELAAVAKAEREADERAKAKRAAKK